MAKSRYIASAKLNAGLIAIAWLTLFAFTGQAQALIKPIGQVGARHTFLYGQWIRRQLNTLQDRRRGGG